jgi:hypothetical protein
MSSVRQRRDDAARLAAPEYGRGYPEASLFRHPQVFSQLIHLLLVELCE